MDDTPQFLIAALLFIPAVWAVLRFFGRESHKAYKVFCELSQHTGGIVAKAGPIFGHPQLTYETEAAAFVLSNPDGSKYFRGKSTSRVVFTLAGRIGITVEVVPKTSAAAKVVPLNSEMVRIANNDFDAAFKVITAEESTALSLLDTNVQELLLSFPEHEAAFGIHNGTGSIECVRPVDADAAHYQRLLAAAQALADRSHAMG